MTETQKAPDTAADPAPAETVDLPWADVQAEHHRMLRLAPDDHLLIYCRAGQGWLETGDGRLDVVGGDLLRAHQKAHLKPGQVRDKTQRMKIADLGFVSHQHMPSTYLAITLVENLQVLTVNHTHRLNAGDIDDLASWGIRYNRAQSYALGEPTAYAAFDAITLATTEE